MIKLRQSIAGPVAFPVCVGWLNTKMIRDVVQIWNVAKDP